MKRPPSWLTPQRRTPRYPSAPATGLAEPSGQPVHYLIDGRAACGVRSVQMRLHTRYAQCVTCPDCLDSFFPVPSQPLPCGSPVGDTGLSADRALTCVKKPTDLAIPLLFGGCPGLLDAGAGIFLETF